MGYRRGFIGLLKKNISRRIAYGVSYSRDLMIDSALSFFLDWALHTRREDAVSSLKTKVRGRSIKKEDRFVDIQCEDKSFNDLASAVSFVSSLMTSLHHEDIAEDGKSFRYTYYRYDGVVYKVNKKRLEELKDRGFSVYLADEDGISMYQGSKIILVPASKTEESISVVMGSTSIYDFHDDVEYRFNPYTITIKLPVMELKGLTAVDADVENVTYYDVAMSHHMNYSVPLGGRITLPDSLAGNELVSKGEHITFRNGEVRVNPEYMYAMSRGRWYAYKPVIGYIIDSMRDGKILLLSTRGDMERYLEIEAHPFSGDMVLRSTKDRRVSYTTISVDIEIKSRAMEGVESVVEKYDKD